MILAILALDHASGGPENRENTFERKTGDSEAEVSSKKANTRLRSLGSALLNPSGS
jgi:hypothetical protein